MTARPEPSEREVEGPDWRAEPKGRGRRLHVPAERLLQDWKEVHERTLAYLAALQIPGAEREGLAVEAVERALVAENWAPDGNALTEAFAALRRLLCERYPFDASRWARVPDEFLAWRVEAMVSSRFPGPAEHKRIGPGADGLLGSMPELARRAMVPLKIERRWVRPRRPRGEQSADRLRVRGKRREVLWTRVARRRRALLLFLVFIPSVIASGFMLNVLPHQGRTWVELGIVLFFGALFGWISIGFWTALLGFFTLIGRRDRFAITRLEGEDGEIDPKARTAIVMPICAEPVDRVFAGLKAIHRSLERTGMLGHFDFFILSDSADPSTWVKEEEAWAEWCREVGGFGRIFYRRRRVRLKRKSGNVADFCRRWGKHYRYMIMLDADSVMSGETIVRLVRMIERHPGAGMIQTAPIAVNRRSLFARVQQFSSRVYGPMFAAGLHYWQLGDGQYWGHNTIIRVKPFADNCGLAPLPGKPPLGGEIMSHDFVEAALIGRAGWSLWLAYDLPGSYEETPSSLLEEMQRDRRWCQGNLQHLRLLRTEGLFGAHRALFLNGALSYVSALLWFCFLILSTVEAIQNALREPDYFPNGPSLFPEWPVWHPNWALGLLVVTGMILFLPKVLSILLILINRRTRAYGGFFKLGLSVLIEIVLSSLFAPVRMVFHSRFVVMNLLGRTVAWQSQQREDSETSWGEAIRRHGVDTVLASAWGMSLFLLNPDYFFWVTPIVVALVLSIPLSVYTSRVRLGERARAWGLFLIPEETNPPPELVDLERGLEEARAAAARIPEMERDGFVRAAVDPYVNALHCALLRGPRALRPMIRDTRQALLDRALTYGPAALPPRERRQLLYDAEATLELHHRVWEIPERVRAARWGRPGQPPST